MALISKNNDKIELLPEHIIDQIKAGEVVERPANLIKEIIENALDAGADRLDLHLIGEGMDLISLTDNGVGIDYEDLPLAFCRHATSKITRFDDIYRLNTFGFRGEALASISAISHLTCTSLKKGKKSAGKVTLEGGRLTSHSKESMSQKHGTALYIKDLFYNTPARLKFIKSKSSEKSAIQKIVDSFIISNPQASFTVKWDDLDKSIYQCTQNDLEERVKQVFNYKNKVSDLIYFSQEFEGHKIQGYLTSESVRSHTKRKQFLFVNGRLFYDKQIHGLLCRVMDSRGWFQGSGSYCLYITAPPSQIDVNVHPSKTTIKFLKHSTVLSMISNSIKNQLKPSAHQLDTFTTPEPKFETPLAHFDAQTFHHLEATSSRQSDHMHETSSLFSHVQAQNLADSITNQTHKCLQIIQHNDIDTILHKANFLKILFENISKKKLEENSMTPLLISEPIKSVRVLTFSDTEKLKSFGFLVEKIDDEMTVVRAVHHSYVSSQIQQLVKTLIETNYTISQIDCINFTIDTNFVKHTLTNQDISSQSHHFLLPLFGDEVTALFPNL